MCWLLNTILSWPFSMATPSPLFNAALQTTLTACLWHYNDTYGDLVFTQVSSDATKMHCSTGQGITASPVFNAALQTSLTACLWHCDDTYGDLVFTQESSDATKMHCSTGQGITPSPLFNAALQTTVTSCSMLLCKVPSQHA